MDLEWWYIGGALGFQLIIVVMLCTVGNPVLFKSKDVFRQADGALVLQPILSDFGFTAMILLIGSTLGFGTTGWPRFAIWAFFSACLWLAWRAYRHRIILSDSTMTVLTWRRFEVAKADITSYQVERDASEGDDVMWIEVHAGARKCKLRKGLVGSREQERAMLDFLGERQGPGD
jgi:hypothetical protein